MLCVLLSVCKRKRKIERQTDRQTEEKRDLRVVAASSEQRVCCVFCYLCVRDTQTDVCVRACVRACVSVCVYVFASVCVSACVCVHTNTHKQTKNIHQYTYAHSHEQNKHTTAQLKVVLEDVILLSRWVGA